MTFDSPLANRSIINAQVDRASAVAADAENASRPATFTLTYRTSGVGYILVPQMQRFDVTFTQEPTFTTGVSIVTPPSPQWQYPMVTAGVYRWNRDRDTGYYTGAFLYFVVKCELNAAAGTNGPAITALETKIAALDAERTAVQNGAPAFRSVEQLTQLMGQLQRTKGDLDAADDAEPETYAHPVLAHHIAFEGVAMKELELVQTELSDSLEPRTTTIGIQVSG